jgi:hypothetical protein
MNYIHGVHARWHAYNDQTAEGREVGRNDKLSCQWHLMVTSWDMTMKSMSKDHSWLPLSLCVCSTHVLVSGLRSQDEQATYTGLCKRAMHAGVGCSPAR